MKPPFPYFGGKMMLASRIIRTFPAHGHYVEPFAGSLAVLLAKAPADHETVNDLDGDLVTFWRVLRDRPSELERACAFTPHARAEHAAAYDLPETLDEIERARRVWVQLTQGRAGVRTKTGWRHYQDPAGSSASMPDYLAGYVGRIAPAVERLRRVSLECRPALDLVRDYGRHDGALLYVDPPYLGSTRSSGSYAVEMGKDDEHRELADALLACRASVVLSGYHSPLYDDLYAGWDRIEFDVGTGQSGEWGARTEVLWSNRKIAEPNLFDMLEDGAA
jgi:DNA adenine methylase